MPLINLRTDLKSLRYGYDRLGAGQSDGSNQPYIKSSIPSGSGPGLGDTDFLLRGGSLLPRAVGRDVSRLTQMMFDFKSPNGLLFSVKQNLLSRSAVNPMAISNNGSLSNVLNDPNKLPLNNGIYLPTSTILQAAANPLGGHLLKQGINPFKSTNDVANGNILSTGFGPNLPLSMPIYLDTDAYNERVNTQGIPTSRLLSFTNSFIKDAVYKPDSPGRFVVQDGTLLYSYQGGPGSTLGVGKTNIQLSKDRTGRNNPFLAGDKNTTDKFFANSNATTKKVSSFSRFSSLSPTPSFGTDSLQYGREDYSVFKRKSVTFQGARIFNSTLSSLYQSITDVDLFQGQFKRVNNDVSALQTFETNVFQTGSFQASSTVPGLKDTLDYDQLMTAGNSGSVKNTILQDFRSNTDSNSPIQSIDYTNPNQRLDGRVNLGSPGSKFERKSYVVGRGTSLDKINALPLYQSSNVDTKKDINDLVKFRIGVINNDNPSLKTYIHFRALINSMDDSYSADWSSQKYMGRGEPLYNYQGFSRNVNLSWTVAAQSKQELMPMYHKLNYLASVCAPDYSSNGYIRGNLIELTVGGYLYNQVGIMQGIQYSVPQESPWEIGINDTATNTNGFDPVRSDETVKEMPMIINVSGFSFLPIQNFVPNIQKNTYGRSAPGPNEKGNLNTFGPQRYIALESRNNNNYDL
tara:strand:- start:4660 stop:6723 length:2064 start_codon:yes stop_codon:yes gene_type:complete